MALFNLAYFFRVKIVYLKFNKLPRKSFHCNNGYIGYGEIFFFN